MEFLSPKDYQKIIESAINKKEEDIAYFFFSQYTQHHATNLNFSDKLEQTMNDLEDQLQREKERKINFEKNKEENKKKKKINVDWDEHIFWYFNGRLHFEYEIFMHNKECFQFTINKMEDLKNGLIKFNELLNNEIEEDEINEIVSTKKIKFKGTPAQFCYIIDLLINKGYIESPTPKGERSAKILLEHFEFENNNPSIESLGKILHKDIDQIKNIEHRSKFQKMPHRNDLDK
jgi:hypothetical protein